MAEATQTEEKGATLAEKIDEPEKKAVQTTTLQQTIYGYEDHFAMALSGLDVDPKRFVRMAFTAVNKNPLLLESDRASLMGALLGCAQLGLEPSGPTGQAYLVPFKEKGQVRTQLIIGYQGLVDLAYRSGRVMSLSAHVIREGDFFDWELGSNARITHRPQLVGDRGPIVGAYAVAVLAGGGQVFDVLNLDQIQARRSRSKAGDKGPWSTDYEAMCRKSAVRQLFKWLPSSAENQQALGADGGVWREIPAPGKDTAIDEGIIDIEPLEDED